VISKRTEGGRHYSRVRADNYNYSRRSPLVAELDPEAPDFGLILRAVMEIERFGFDSDDPDILRRAIEKGRADYRNAAEHRERLAAIAARRPTPVPNELVYYVRIGNRCKIGYTSNMSKRMATINPEEVLVTEPGTLDLEHMRHREFAHLRTHGEWFRLEDPLTSHIERLRAAS
jgi:hypothetical protein